LLRRRGFSLLEVLLGAILFSVMLVYMANIWGVHARTVGHTRARLVASFLAAQQLEECITVGYRGVDALKDKENPTLPITTVIRGVERTVEYKYYVGVYEHDRPGLTGRLKVVLVRVQFNEDSKIGGESEVVYRTILSDT
jgi:prepilin-type N-terminal cleavage/methylation domain-containing protein